MNEDETKSALLAEIASLYLIHAYDFCGSRIKDMAGQEAFVDTMEDNILPRICTVIGHAELVPDQCGLPHRDYCPRCNLNREAIESV